jgi:hypothetical protein
MNSTPRPRPHPLLLLLAVVAVVAAVAAAWTVPALAVPEAWTPPPDTIVEIEGDEQNGFTIHHYDGSEISPPTDSEAHAECQEYDLRVQRVRCHAEVRTWYDALAEHQKSLHWAALSGR